MLEYKEYFDLSNFPKDSIMYCGNNRKKTATMKDEYADISIHNFWGLKSKSYGINSTKGEKMTHKGHKYNFTCDEYDDVLKNNKIMRHPMNKITSYDHNIFAQKMDKISLSWVDHKIYICPNEIHTLALKHKGYYKK